MKNNVAETREILKKVNSRLYKNILLYHMWWNEYWLYDSEADKINWVWIAKWTLDYIKWYMFWKFWYNERN